MLALGALITATGLGAASFALHNFLAHDSRFRIAGLNNIEADSLSEVSRNDILPVFGEDVGKNIFFIRLADRRQQLEQIPWVERATVMRLLPDRIRVQLVERQPVAFVRQGSQIGLIDANGILLSMPPEMMAQRHYSFPVVSGINAQNPPENRRQRMNLYTRLIQDLDADGRGISKQISEIDLSDAEDARVMLPDSQGEVLAHFGEDHFRERYQRYTQNIAGWRSQYPRLASVDLRYEDQMVLTMKTESQEAAEKVPAQSATPPPAGTASPAPAIKNAALSTTSPAHTAEKRPALATTKDKTETTRPAREKETPHASRDAATGKSTAKDKTFSTAKRPDKATQKLANKNAPGSTPKTSGTKKGGAATTSAKAPQKKDTKTLRVAEKTEKQKHSDPKRDATGNNSRRRSGLPSRAALDPVLGQ